MSLEKIIRKTRPSKPSSMQVAKRLQQPECDQPRRNVNVIEEKPDAKQGSVHIGAAVKVMRTFAACDIAEIYGSLDGEIQARELIIHEGGHLTGMAVCRFAHIAGELDGEIEASELLKIQSTGRADGKIGYARLVIEDGGLIKGELFPSTTPKLIKTKPHSKNADGNASKTPDHLVISAENMEVI